MIAKVKSGSTHLFHWTAPEPISGSPTLTVKAAGVAIDGIPALTVVAGPATISAVPEGGQTGLTASAPVATSERATMEWGHAFYVSDEDGVRAVKVRQINGAAITLTTAPIPTLVSGGTLRWASYWTLFSSDDVTATQRRDVTWEVSYLPLFAGSADGELAPRVDGPYQLVVVNRPFSTGLTSPRVMSYYPELVKAVGATQEGFQPYIDQALEWMVGDIRAELRPKGCWEDDLQDGSSLSLPHLYLTAALIVERTDPIRAEDLRARYHSTLGAAMKAAQLDMDGDGIPDEDPIDLRFVPLQGKSLPDVVQEAYTPYIPKWTRNTRF